MRIAVVGAGRVGRAIGAGWTRAGHEVVYGVRGQPGQGEAAIDAAAESAPVIAIATPWDAVEGICRGLGGQSGKIILDCTNPLVITPAGPEHKNSLPASGAELIQQWCKGAAVFKTLNQTGFETLANPSAFPAKPVMLIAGDDAEKKKTVVQLVSDLGLEAVDAGPLANAGLLESFAKIWIDLAFKRGLGRNFAFTLARRS
jgi:8-hydroxy-5-deazaflavin:NADPH oxidoreductase